MIELQGEVMQTMKDFYKPLKKAVSAIQKDNAAWSDKYK